MPDLHGNLERSYLGPTQTHRPGTIAQYLRSGASSSSNFSRYYFDAYEQHCKNASTRVSQQNGRASNANPTSGPQPKIPQSGGTAPFQSPYLAKQHRLSNGTWQDGSAINVGQPAEAHNTFGLIEDIDDPIPIASSKSSGLSFTGTRATGTSILENMHRQTSGPPGGDPLNRTFPVRHDIPPPRLGKAQDSAHSSMFNDSRLHAPSSWVGNAAPPRYPAPAATILPTGSRYTSTVMATRQKAPHRAFSGGPNSGQREVFATPTASITPRVFSSGRSASRASFDAVAQSPMSRHPSGWLEHPQEPKQHEVAGRGGTPRTSPRDADAADAVLGAVKMNGAADHHSTVMSRKPNSRPLSKSGSLADCTNTGEVGAETGQRAAAPPAPPTLQHLGPVARDVPRARRNSESLCRSNSAESCAGSPPASLYPTLSGESISSRDQYRLSEPAVLHRNALPYMSQCAALQSMERGAGCTGLENLGNTCYMNSTLQILNSVPELVAWAHLEGSNHGQSRRMVVVPALSGLINSMWRQTGEGVVRPSRVLQAMARRDARWGDGSQQDSQEFMHSLLEALQEECNRVSAKPQYKQLDDKLREEQQALQVEQYARSWNDSFVDDIFGGLMQSTLQCQRCQRKSFSFEPFIDLAVPLPVPSSGKTTIESCLQAFFGSEQLDGSESFKCEKCQVCCPHTKRLQLWRPPHVLLLSLKRFSPRSSGNVFSRFRSASKNTASVDLEIDALDLGSCCNPLGLKAMKLQGGPQKPVYELTAVSHHTGSLEGGHYTACARSAVDGSWYNFNDSRVRREQKLSRNSSSAYILVYRLKGAPM